LPPPRASTSLRYPPPSEQIAAATKIIARSGSIRPMTSPKTIAGKLTAMA